MLFNSIEFFVFLVITYLLYRILPFRGQNIMLLIASYVFYGWWDIHLLFLILLSTVIDFYSGAMIDSGRLSRSHRFFCSWSIILAALAFDTIRWNAVYIRTAPNFVSVHWSQLFPSALSGWLVFLGSVALVVIGNLLHPRCVALKEHKRRKFFLWVSICANLGILGFFKYSNFFIHSAQEAIHALGVPVEYWHLNLILPAGISFYTFKAISYAVDLYKGKMTASYEFLNFALFWAFFPPLLAGPIDRASHLLPQLSNPRQVSFQQSAEGLFLILFGLFKKVAIADGVAGSVNAIYETAGAVSWIDVVAATFLFAIQIYCDFSGYSDIGRGVSKLFGIELMLNFDLPYISKDPSEFWRRWHISLSTWLRDYLYIPLGGNRKGELRTYQNLMTTMVLGGLWHGAAWNFILWGFYQGTLLSAYRVFTPKESKKHSEASKSQGFGNLRGIAAIVLFFIVTCYGWLLFRADSLTQVMTFTKILFADFGNFALRMPKPPLSAMLGIPLLIGYELLEYFKANRPHFNSRFDIPARAVFYATLIFILLMGTSNAPAQFIYSQF
ncbi:MAG: MBOAT family protein [Rhizonema sp. NSF051]|nr:MBOAT family protein [Rhizonema sp. NSF051]